jgi:hypothetical protein
MITKSGQAGAEFDHYEFNSGKDDGRSGHPFSLQMEELCALYHNELERVSPSYEGLTWDELEDREKIHHLMAMALVIRLKSSALNAMLADNSLIYGGAEVGENSDPHTNKVVPGT